MFFGISVRQIADDRGALLIGEAREFGRGVVGISDAVRVGQRERCSSVGVIVANRDGAYALLHLGQSIRVVVGVRDSSWKVWRAILQFVLFSLSYSQESCLRL